MNDTLRIIKIGGKVVEDDTLLLPLCDRLAVMAADSTLLVVHGGGSMAGRLATRMGVETRMHDGRRITDAATLDIAVMAYAGLANKRITAALQARGVNACGLSGCDMGIITSARRPVGTIDWGFVGDIESVNAAALDSLLHSGVAPVISPITCARSGQLLNTNADSVASAVAVAMATEAGHKVELVFCLDKPGVLADPEDNASAIVHIDRALFESLRAEGAIHSGMIPKLENAFATLDAGVTTVRITNATHLDAGTVVRG